MDVVDTGADLVGVTVLLEGVKQLHVSLGGLDGDDISIETLDGGEDVVEVGVAEVGVGLELVGDTSGGELERVNSPLEVGVPVRATERETLTNGGLVDLDGVDTGVLEIDDLVAESEGKLLGLDLARDIGTREGPVEDGDGSGKHTLHGLLGDALGVRAPLDGHGGRARDVGDDDGRADVAGSVALNPTVLGEDKAVEELTEVLDHVVTLGFTVDEEVEANLLLEADNGLNLLLDELVVLLLGELALAELGTSLTNLLGLGEGADGGGGELGEVEGLGLDLLANGEGAATVELVIGDGSDTLADGVIGVLLESAALGNGDLVGLESSSDLGIL